MKNLYSEVKEECTTKSVHSSSALAVPSIKIVFLIAKWLQKFKAAACELSYCIGTYFIRVGWERRREKEQRKGGAEG